MTHQCFHLLLQMFNVLKQFTVELKGSCHGVKVVVAQSQVEAHCCVFVCHYVVMFRVGGLSCVEFDTVIPSCFYAYE